MSDATKAFIGDLNALVELVQNNIALIKKDGFVRTATTSSCPLALYGISDQVNATLINFIRNTNK